jgi:hypothetical protein
MKWPGTGVAFPRGGFSEDVGTRGNGPTLCSGIVALLTPPGHFSLFFFLFAVVRSDR